MPELKITIDAEGNTEIDAVGFKGKKCMEASKPFEKALGVVSDRTKKPELLKEGDTVNVTGNRVNLRK